jgi:hypothetical protein
MTVSALAGTFLRSPIVGTSWGQLTLASAFPLPSSCVPTGITSLSFPRPLAGFSLRALIAADIDLMCHVILDFVGEDYMLAARILAKLETRFPAVAWRTRFAAVMETRPEYTASGLSKVWWRAEVARLADAYKS